MIKATNKDEKRIRFIKNSFVIVKTKCDCCGKIYENKKMWKVSRWGINRNISNWFYCHDCMPTKNDVLNEIDTDYYIFGIFPIDDFVSFKKKDYTKVNEISFSDPKGIIPKDNTKIIEDSFSDPRGEKPINKKRKVLTKNN